MLHDSDQQLLDRFAARQDHAALAEIVRRYIGLVHAAAHRQVRDPHLAADITQAVFIVLVRKAPSLRADTNLAAWLFTVTRHAVANARRVQARQRIHETQMATITRAQSAPPADKNAEVADEIRSVLDDGIAKLSHVERTSVLMHFFGNKSHCEVGAELGMTEEAARKRVARSVEKLRTILTHRRGGAVTSGATTSAVLASVMSAESALGATIAGQSALVASTANVALLSNALATASGGGAFAVVIAQSVMRTLRASRAKLAVAMSVVALLLIGVTTILAFARHGPSIARSPAPIIPPLALSIGPATRVDFLGASIYPPDANSWLSAGGGPIALPDERLLNVSLPTAVPPQYEVAVRVERPTSEVMRLHVAGSDAGSNMMYHDGDAIVVVAVFSFGTSRDTAKMELAIADGDWKTLASNDRPNQSTRVDVPGVGSIAFDAITSDDDATTSIIVRHGRLADHHQLVAMDLDGAAHVASQMAVTILSPSLNSRCQFDLPTDRIARIVLQTRPFSRFVDFDEISLGPDRLTKPTIKLRNATSTSENSKR
ncbi:MAG: sigma-70 family RNA polymerase sigma factor [Anaerolineae bacterium]|nr:sigma-70 family RNA polymerase sigma factor [Phycisphaerae bacterium]